MPPLPRPVRKARARHVHGAERVSDRRIETGSVAADREGIGQWRDSAGWIPGQPAHAKIVRQVRGRGAREACLVEGFVLHVDGVEVNAVTAAENRLSADLP